MQNPKTELSSYNNSRYRPGAGILVRTAWYFINACFFLNPAMPLSWLKILLLRMFGARVGKGVLIKPRVNIKYPWNLRIGNHCWIGEDVWIDNLAKVIIADNCCISQGAMLLTGNHDYSKTTFDLMTGEILLEEGVWLGAKSIVGPGVKCKSHAVLSAGSVTSAGLDEYSVYRGNPAVKIKEREIK